MVVGGGDRHCDGSWGVGTGPVIVVEEGDRPCDGSLGRGQAL